MTETSLAHTRWAPSNPLERSAEPLEMSVMCVPTVVAAQWVARRRVRPTSMRLLAVGLVALGLLVTAEVAMAIDVQGVTVRGYVASRGPIGGAWPA